MMHVLKKLLQIPLMLILKLAFALGVMGNEPNAGETGRFGFHRTIDPQWMPDDSRQWSRFGESVILADLRGAIPATALTEGRRMPGRWKVLSYEAGEIRGNALSIFMHTQPPPVRVALERSGWQAVYLGLVTTSNGLDDTLRNGVRVRLVGEAVYRRMSNSLDLVRPRRDVIQEQFLTVAQLGPKDEIEFASLPNLPATVAYVRLVPVTAGELAAWRKDGAERRHRTSIYAFDGGGWIWPYRPRTREDLLAAFRGMERTDAGSWWFQIGADQVYYPSKVGTLRFDGTEDFPSAIRRDHAEAIRALLSNGVNPLRVAREEAAAQGREFHVMMRPAAWAASYPYEEIFASRFYEQHPEWRSVDRAGKRTFYMSYAVPEVRRHVVALLREAVEICDPDGVGFLFNRGMPLMLWEPAFCAQFSEVHGVDPRELDPEDPRVHQLRGRNVNLLFREVRAMLDEAGQSKRRRYRISATTFGNREGNERFGLDVPAWVREGLVDTLAIAGNVHHVRSPKGGPVTLDVGYYRELARGTSVKLYPLVLTVRPGELKQHLKRVLGYLDQEADGLSVWDPFVDTATAGTAIGETGVDYQGNTLDLFAYLGRPALLRHWSEHGVPPAHRLLLDRLGENTYSDWFPNTGY